MSGATARQYASLVAASSAPIRKNARQIHGCAVALRPATTCAVYRLTAEFTTKTLTLRLRGAMARSSKAYIGPPPSEVAPLVQSTMSDAQELIRVVKDGHNDYGQVELAQGRLLADLDGWRPYGA